MECTVIGGHGAGGEAERCSKELAALVEHGLLDHLSRLKQQCLRNSEPERFRGLEVDHELEAPASLRIKTVCRARPDPDQSEHSKDADRSRESSGLT
jgi:hypothetical protein